MSHGQHELQYIPDYLNSATALSQTASFSSQNAPTTNNRLLAGLRPDPLGELIALSKPSSWILGQGRGTKRRENEGGKGKIRAGEKRLHTGTSFCALPAALQSCSTEGILTIYLTL